MADLCAPGWHVCESAGEVGFHVTHDQCDTSEELPDLFFASRQSGSGNCTCDDYGNSDLFGCGSHGDQSCLQQCGVLARASGDLCTNLTSSWNCGSDSFEEAANVTKPDPGGGGVLCCRD